MDKQVLSFQELDNILRLLEASQRPGTVEIRLGDVKLKVTKADVSDAAQAPPSAAPAAGAVVAAPAAAAPVAAEPAAAPPAAAVALQAAPSTEAAPAPASDDAALPTNGHTVKSPMNGVFYRQPSPGAPAFVEEGQRVEAGDDLAIIEVMKLMNRLSSPVSGIVRRVCAANEQLVEKNAALFIIETDEAGTP